MLIRFHFSSEQAHVYHIRAGLQVLDACDFMMSEWEQSNEFVSIVAELRRGKKLTEFLRLR